MPCCVADVKRLMLLFGPCMLLSQVLSETCLGFAESAPLGLDVEALLVEVGQQAVVVLVEDVARERRQAREDVSGAAGVLAARHPRAKLPCRGTLTGECAAPRIARLCTAVLQLMPKLSPADMLQWSRITVQTVTLCCAADRVVYSNAPEGTSRLMLLLPTKSWARPTMVPARLASPWWYAACSET